MRVPILTYPTLAITGGSYVTNPLAAFARDLETITECGFRVLPLRGIVDAWLAGRHDELENVVGLCLEDGADFAFRDIDHPTAGPQRSAFNAMRDFVERGASRQPDLHATSFVVASPEARRSLDRTCMTGSGWWSDDWWQDAAASGLMHIGNHSWDHNHEALPAELAPTRPGGTFRTIDRRELADHEIAQAATYLGDRVDNPGLGLFAYPYGEASWYLANVYMPKHGLDMGLVAAFTDRAGYVDEEGDRWLLPRFVWARDWRSPTELRGVLEGAKEAPRMRSDGVATISDPEDRGRYDSVPRIIAEWLAPHGGVAGREILDFGCGQGVTALALAREHGARRVVGVDIGPDVERATAFARQQLGLKRLPDNTCFVRVPPDSLHDPEDRFDIVYSWSVFEHVDQRCLSQALHNIRRSLKPGGLFLVQIAPLYYSARGAHLYGAYDEPWAHLTMQQDLLRERVMRAAPDETSGRATWSVYETLNRLTAAELITHVRRSGFEILRDVRVRDPLEPPASLTAIYHRDVLQTDQVVALARRID